MDDKLLYAIELCFNKKPEDAIKYLISQGVEITWDWKEQLDAIKKHCFTVSKVSSADALEMIKSELIAAMDNGTPYEDFKKSLTETLTNNGYATKDDGNAWRLDVIYRTNLQNSYMAGRYKQMKEVEEDFPYWQYIAVMDSHTRPAHAALNGKVLKANDPFWSKSTPSNGYNCRCRTRCLDDQDIKKKNLKVFKGSELNFKPDEGFDNNPAEMWKPDLSKYSPDIKKILEKELLNGSLN